MRTWWALASPACRGQCSVACCKLLCQIWSDGPQQEVGSGGPTHQEEEVGRLRVVDPWDPVEQGGTLSTFLHEELHDELGLTYWNAQHPQALLGWWEVWVSLPDNGVLAALVRSSIPAVSMPPRFQTCRVDASKCRNTTVRPRCH